MYAPHPYRHFWRFSISGSPYLRVHLEYAMRFRAIFSAFILILMAASPLAAQESSITLVTHDSFSISEDVLAQFTEETGISVEILRAGDAGLMVNQAVLTAANPLGDVMFGIDNTFLTRAFTADVFLPYESPMLADVPENFILDDENRVTPVDFGDVCLNYDIQFFEESGLALPETLLDLTKPEYRGLLVTPNPALSSPGLAFLAATAAVFGDSDDDDGYTYLDFWQELVANEVFVSEGWTDAYYGQFSGSAGSEGDRPLVVSYASSPPAEVYFAEDAEAPAPTAAITAPDTCFRQIEFAGILNGTDNVEAAQQFIDFVLSKAFQEDMPLNMFVFPVIADAVLPDVFAEYASIPEQPVLVDADMIDANRDRWIQEWTETVLR